MKSPRRLAALAIFAIVAMSAFGFAASNTVPGTNAGQGSSGVSGFVISNVNYSYSGPDISNVSFDISPAAGSVSVKLVAADTTFSTCTLNVAGDHASCGITGVTVLEADELNVVAVD
jgi:archaellin